MTTVPPSSSGQGQVALDPVPLAGADQRAADGARVGGVAGRQLAQHLGRGLDRLVELAPGDEQPGGDGTALAGVGAHGEGGGGAGPPQVGVVQDDEGRLAPELQEDLLERLGRRGHHRPAGGGGAGEADLVHPGVGGQQGADRVLGRRDDVDHTGRDVGLLGDQAAEHGGAPRRVGRRLEDHGVAGGQGRPQLGQVDLVGDVPRGDGPDHAGGLAADPAVRGDAHGRGVPEVGLPLVALGQVGHPSRDPRPGRRAGPSR